MGYQDATEEEREEQSNDETMGMENRLKRRIKPSRNFDERELWRVQSGNLWTLRLYWLEEEEDENVAMERWQSSEPHPWSNDKTESDWSGRRRRETTIMIIWSIRKVWMEWIRWRHGNESAEWLSVGCWSGLSVHEERKKQEGKGRCDWPHSISLRSPAVVCVGESRERTRRRMRERADKQDCPLCFSVHLVKQLKNRG